MHDEKICGHFLQNKFGDRYLYELNGAAFNKVGANVCFSRFFGDDLFAENCLYIICGSDSGLLPAYLVDHGLPEGSYYIFIEPPEVLDLLKNVLPEQGFHQKINIATVENWLTYAKKIDFQNFSYLGNLKFVPSFAAVDGRYSDYLELSNFLQEELEKINWGLNNELGSELFHQRQFQNLPENRCPATCLKGGFSGKTAVVLGGGPSLDEALPWLLENRENLFILSVSRIARRLLDIGLVPDILLSVDPTELSFDISKEMLAFWEKTIFIHKYHVVSDLISQWKGRSLFFGARVPWESSLNEDLIDAGGPTVTNTAIDLAILMDFSQILLAGVDLCFGRDGHTHALGSNERKVGPQLSYGNLWVETNGGFLAESTPDLSFAIDRISVQATHAKKSGNRVINLSEGAAKVEEVEFLLPAKISIAKLDEPAFEMLCKRLPEGSSEEREHYYNEALTELIRADKAFREIKKLCKEALSASDAFFGKKRGISKGQEKYRHKMNRVEKKLKNNFSDFSRLIKRFGIRSFLKLTQGDIGRDWDQDDVEKLGRIYYEAYFDAADRLKANVETTIERLRARLEEEKSAPVFEKLLEQWRKDGHPGRSLVWQHHHPEQVIPAKFIQEFEDLEDEFNEALQQQETAHLKRSRTRADLGPVRGKLQLMYKRQQTGSLQALVGSLETLSGVEASSLMSLGRGYLAIIEGDNDRAIEEFQQIIDLQEQVQDVAILEDALKQLLRITLKLEDYQNALVIAECLSSISAVYTPFYADLLWLLGEKGAALDRYADYLEQIPDDHGIMIKLGTYYQDLGHSDGAKMMYEAVLEQDATNSTAKTLLAQLV